MSLFNSFTSYFLFFGVIMSVSYYVVWKLQYRERGSDRNFVTFLTLMEIAYKISQVWCSLYILATISSLLRIFIINGFLKKILFIYLFIFIFDCVGSSFLCEGFLQLRRAGATLHCGAWASHRRGLSCCGAQAPDAQAQ